MTAKYWIKLYQEMLYDPKMGLMSDRFYRRTIELFLLAGEADEEGYLPPVEAIAWKLRLDAEQLETEMIELQKVGILSVQNGRWYVTKFAERQAAVPPAERMRQFRDREKKREYYEPVTHGVTKRNTDTDTDTEENQKRGEAEAAAAGAVFREFQENIGLLTPVLGEAIGRAVDDYGQEWVIAAIREAASSGARNWKYIQAILDRWKVEGFRTRKNHRGSEPITAEKIRQVLNGSGV